MEHEPQTSLRTEEWLGMVGVGALQDFQDTFTGLSGLPLILVDRGGSPLLVPSAKVWFCDFVKSTFSHGCSCFDAPERSELVRVYSPVENFAPFVRTCDFGITRFAVPMYYNRELMAFWLCKGFVFDDTPRCEQLRNKFGVQVLSHEDFGRHIESLALTARLMDIHLDAGPAKASGSSAPLGQSTILSDRLTRRENEIASLMCCGLSNREIAQKLFLSEKTVKTHVSNILAKTGSRNRVQLIYEFSGPSKNEGDGRVVTKER